MAVRPFRRLDRCLAEHARIPTSCSDPILASHRCQPRRIGKSLPQVEAEVSSRRRSAFSGVMATNRLDWLDGHEAGTASGERRLSVAGDLHGAASGIGARIFRAALP